MGETTSYARVPARLIPFVKSHPDVLELLGSFAGPRPVLRDLDALLVRAAHDKDMLLDYGRLSLATLRAFCELPQAQALAENFAEVSIDKARQGLCFLLGGGSSDPDGALAALSGGGEALVVDKDLFLVPPRLFHPADVQDFADAIDEVVLPTLRQRYDAARMRALGIYPAQLWQDGPDALEWLLEHFHSLVELVAGAARGGDALVVEVTL